MTNSMKLMNQYWTDIYFHLHYTHNEKISHQAVRILQLVEKAEHAGINEVASHLGISHNTASEHIKRLVEKKYVEKTRHAEDERKITLRLTEAGSDVLLRNTSLDEDQLQGIFDEMNDQEKNLVIDGFRLLSERAKR